MGNGYDDVAFSLFCLSDSRPYFFPRGPIDSGKGLLSGRIGPIGKVDDSDLDTPALNNQGISRITVFAATKNAGVTRTSAFFEIVAYFNCPLQAKVSLVKNMVVGEENDIESRLLQVVKIRIRKKAKTYSSF